MAKPDPLADLSTLEILRSCIVKARVLGLDYDWWLNQVMKPDYQAHDLAYGPRDTRKFVTLWFTRLGDPAHVERYRSNQARIAADRAAKQARIEAHRARVAKQRRKQRRKPRP